MYGTDCRHKPFAIPTNTHSILYCNATENIIHSFIHSLILGVGPVCEREPQCYTRWTLYTGVSAWDLFVRESHSGSLNAIRVCRRGTCLWERATVARWTLYGCVGVGPVCEREPQWLAERYTGVSAWDLFVRESHSGSLNAIRVCRRGTCLWERATVARWTLYGCVGVGPVCEREPQWLADLFVRESHSGSLNAIRVCRRGTCLWERATVTRWTLYGCVGVGPVCEREPQWLAERYTGVSAWDLFVRESHSGSLNAIRVCRRGTCLWERATVNAILAERYTGVSAWDLFVRESHSDSLNAIRVCRRGTCLWERATVTRWTLYGCVGVGPVCEREPQWLAERYTGVSAWDLFVRESHSGSLNAIRVCRRGTCLWERATVTRWVARWTLYGCVGVGPVCEREPQWLAERYTGVSAWDLFVRESHSGSLNAIRVCRRGTCLWERATVARWTLYGCVGVGPVCEREPQWLAERYTGVSAWDLFVRESHSDSLNAIRVCRRGTCLWERATVTRWTLYGCVGVGPVCERESHSDSLNAIRVCRRGTCLWERATVTRWTLYGCVGVGPVCEREPQWLAEHYTGVSAWDLFVRESHSGSLNAIRVCRRGTCLWEREPQWLAERYTGVSAWDLFVRESHSGSLNAIRVCRRGTCLWERATVTRWTLYGCVGVGPVCEREPQWLARCCV